MSFRFRNFRVYQEAKKIHKEIVIIVNKFPREYYYLADQLRRSSLSIVLNIAEGSSKQSDKDFNRFITISLGSIDEAVATLEICLELQLISQETFTEFERRLEALSKQLGSFSKSLKGQRLVARSQ